MNESWGNLSDILQKPGEYFPLLLAALSLRELL